MLPVIQDSYFCGRWFSLLTEIIRFYFYEGGNITKIQVTPLFGVFSTTFLQTHDGTFMRYISKLVLNENSRIQCQCLKSNNDLNAWSLFLYSPGTTGEKQRCFISHVSCRLSGFRTTAECFMENELWFNGSFAPIRKILCASLCMERSNYWLYCLKMRQFLFCLNSNPVSYLRDIYFNMPPTIGQRTVTKHYFASEIMLWEGGKVMFLQVSVW